MLDLTKIKLKRGGSGKRGDDEQQIRTLIYVMGPQASETEETFVFASDDPKKYDAVLTISSIFIFYHAKM